MNKSSRYDDLELLRGLAAIAVVVYHLRRAFIPPQRAIPLSEAIGLSIEPPFVLALVNGPFMVTVFFVLSSFALTVKLLEVRSPGAVLIAMLKRFPRLFPLVLIGTLLPALLFVGGLMWDQEVAALIGSPWLDRSGGVKVHGDWPTPSLGGALADSLLLFDRGFSQYNSVLWTMRYELLGSLIALGVAFVLAGKRRPVFDVAVTGVIAILAIKIHPLCSICAVTVLLTKYLRVSPITFSPPVATAMILAGLVLGSTYKPFPDEILADPEFGRYVPHLDWLIHGLGATILFLGVHRWRRVSAPDWAFARLLGSLSFAVYVLHEPIIASLGSAIIAVMGYAVPSVIAAFVATAVATALLSLGVARFDGWWVARLNEAARAITSGRFALRGVQARGTDAP